MYPNDLYPNGYLKIQNNFGNYLDINNKNIDTDALQHIPLTKK